VLTARFEDHSDEVSKMIAKRLAVAIRATAEKLAENYKKQLMRQRAPPHSKLGRIPYMFFGQESGIPNNRPETGFSSEQQDFLATYIEGGAEYVFGDVDGYVGFMPSHVTSRDQNYLLEHDRTGRPWVKPVFESSRGDMIRVFETKLMELNR
jgi:hypothetical protein